MNTGGNREFAEYYRHPEDEFVHVIEGAIQMDLGESGMLELAAGDSPYYPGGTLNRWRTTTGIAYRVLAVKEVANVVPAQRD